MASEPTILDGAYRLIRRAATGATSDVFHAVDTATGVPVAVKVLKRTLAEDEAMIARFKREADLLGSFSDPHIVRLIRHADVPEGVLLVMEWAEGQRLDVAVEQGALDAPARRQVLEQLAGALSSIHRTGIVHRDLKPENIIVDLEGGVHVRLLDFGIARFADPRRSASHFVSSSGSVVGTPRYLAPEQILNRAIDTRTDVYAFGVLGYRLVGDGFPFTGANDLEVMQKQVGELAPPLYTTSPVLEPLIPIVMACLEKKPDDRPTHGMALKGLLAAAPAELPVRKRRWWRR